MSPSAPPDPAPLAGLPEGVRSRFVDGVNGLRMHLLEAGFEPPGRPCVLLLHGFPELAYGWRKLMPALAQAGYHAIAPDQRGYGRTTGWDGRFDGDLASFGMPNLVRDALALVFALGQRQVHAVVGHDFGSPVAAWCALARPDVFPRVALMSSPFAGPPDLPFDTGRRATAAGAATSASAAPAAGATPRAIADLTRLARPRKHYQWCYSTRASCCSTRDARSTCRRASSAARATGACTRSPASSSGCARTRAHG